MMAVKIIRMEKGAVSHKTSFYSYAKLSFAKLNCWDKVTTPQSARLFPSAFKYDSSSGIQPVLTWPTVSKYSASCPSHVAQRK